MRISFVKTFGRVLILAGALALAYSGYVYLEERRLQRAADHTLEEQMLHGRSARGRPDIVLPRPGVIIGRIDIPRIHVSALILEGTDSRILRIGAGHVQGTALPGTIGNVGVAAHRDSFFRPLREIRHDDMISLTTPHGVYRYHVQGTEIVDPNDIQVLNQTRDPELTLVTCYPFYYVGSAPKRFIVHARLQS
jgi:sortase A